MTDDHADDCLCDACYDRAYKDAHPGDPDCDECGGRGQVFDEMTGNTSRCRDCWSDVEGLFTDTGGES